MVTSIVRGTFRAPATPGVLLDGGTIKVVAAACQRDRVDGRKVPFPDPSDTPRSMARATRAVGPTPVVHETIFPI